ncbi:hypothetical protein CANTEDRAFT_106660 [Yamadazyma tenuis ATCC 10573]|uniref:pH-response regulator protein palF/RIM8 n=1 Tax=Candida tenuis (strain ATCC 10573 / BCRC 21748 / CBS 615 / JCM 9827 / NBRC 10315 / NRRL Y-1498 / VKM Y-70) TaxID=590646 RepID=G3B728_CANTC|nr:uncharacterized protein CANTEDRAFT_106660 [Yamadazyma tenuis ATCC 10573]EGV63082.1 hypothetical protein CANTEDRAFT_106660 [Yamadazyma tenuis ATCC 10573]
MRKAVSRIIPGRSKSFLDGPSTGPAPASGAGPVQTPNTASSSPFRIDFNSVSDFYIVLDKPHNSWLPGDEVSGQIILITKKNLANIVITLSLVGYVKINGLSHSKLRPVKHSLFNHTIKIYGDDLQPTERSDGLSSGLYKGEHRFPFIVKLPNKRIYTSIDFGKGSITYLLKATMSDSNMVYAQSNTPGDSNPSSPGLLAKTKNLKILNNSNYSSEKLINLINPIDVSTLLPPKTKRLIIKDPRYNRRLSRTQSSNSTINTFNTFGTFSSNNSDPNENTNSNSNSPRDQEMGESLENQPDDHNETPTTPHAPSNSVDYASKPNTIKVSLAIPEKGYLRGELIPVKLNINHLRKVQDVNGIIITFVRVCRLESGPDGIYDSFRKDLGQKVIPIYVDPINFKAEISTNIRVPADCFPTISGCPLVSFQYFVEVLINLSGKSVSLVDNEQTKSSVVSETGRQSPIYSSTVSDFNHKATSSFINTDKFKHSKKFLQLTSEVVIGTHRSQKDSDSSASVSNPLSSDIPLETPPSRGSSLRSESSPIVPAAQSHAAQIIPQPLFNVIPEAMEINHFNGRAPDYNEIHNESGLLPFPEQPAMSEKDQMRAHERSLLPSEPFLSVNDVESRESVSPIMENAQLLEPSTPPQETNGGTDFNFFSNEQSPNNNEQEDQYSQIDYVPNYERSNNDPLVEGNSTSEH